MLSSSSGHFASRAQICGSGCCLLCQLSSAQGFTCRLLETFFLIYHNETMHRLVLPVIHSVLISTLLMSQTGDFQLFRGWLLQCWTLKQLFCFSKVGHCHLSASLWFHHLVFYLMTVIVEGLNMLPLQIPPHQTACTKMYLSLYFPWELKKKKK